MLTIHHLNDSRSQRILWLAEELGLPYRIERHTRTAAGLAPDSLKRLHPLGKAPVVEHHGRRLAETGAIVAYMARGSALLPDEGSDAGDQVRYWLHYAEGSAMPPLLMRMVMSRLIEGAPWIVRPVARGLAGGLDRAWLGAELARHADWWETTLARGGWFAGDAFTAADVMMSFPVEMAALRPDATGRTATRDWLARIHARPAYARALNAGGPYSGAAAS